MAERKGNEGEWEWDVSGKASRLFNGINCKEGGFVLFLDLVGLLHEGGELAGTAEDDDKLGLFDGLILALDFDGFDAGLLQCGVSEPSALVVACT